MYAPSIQKGHSPVRQSDRAYTALRADIVEWRLKPGDLLTEGDLAARLGVSRTPVREALQWLTREGLVQHVPGRGAAVASVSLDDVLELFQMREALECYAAGLAARSPMEGDFRRLESEFRGFADALLPEHFDETAVAPYFDLIDQMDEAVSQATSNGRLVRAITETRAHIRRFRRMAKLNHARLAETTHEHAIICGAIADGNEAAAVQATRRHIHASLNNVLHELGRNALSSLDVPTSTRSVGSIDIGGPNDGGTE